MTRSETSACPCSARARRAGSAQGLTVACLGVWALLTLGCNTIAKDESPPGTRIQEAVSRDPAAPVAAEPHATLEHGQLVKALDALLTPLPKPLRILTITALPSVVVAQVQNTQNPNEVHQYQYTHKDGRVEGPQKVKLMGKGALKDNLFRPPSAEPKMAEDALSNVTNQYKHPARKLVMIRNLPESMDIQFRVFLDTPSGELVVVTDKHGRVLGPLAPSASSTQ